MLIVTTETIPGKEIVEVLGTVTAISVQTKSIFSDIGAGFKNIAGGSLGKYEQMGYNALQVAQSRVAEQAKNLGANAIVAMKIATPNTTQHGSAEICVYGTAVKYV